MHAGAVIGHAMLDQDVPLGDYLPAGVEDRRPAGPAQLVSRVCQAGFNQLGGQDVIDVEEESGSARARPAPTFLALGWVQGRRSCVACTVRSSLGTELTAVGLPAADRCRRRSGPARNPER